MVRDSVDAGGAGVAIGRNIFQADSPADMTRAIAGIVHDGLEVEDAVRILRVATEMKFAWLMAPDTYWDEKKAFITAALESGIDHIVDTSDAERIKKLGSLTLISPEEEADIVLIGKEGEGDGTLELPETLDYSRDLEMAAELKSGGKEVAAYVEIRSKAHEELARKLGRIVDYLILVGEDWKIIPLENIIADLQEEDVKLVAAVQMPMRRGLPLRPLNTEPTVYS